MRTLVLILAITFTFGINAEHRGGEHTVTNEDLGYLKQTTQRIMKNFQTVLEETDDEEVIPRARDRRIFRQDMEAALRYVLGNEGIPAWIEYVKSNVPQPPPPEPELVKYTLKANWVVGSEDTKDTGAAYQSHSAECDKVSDFFRGILGRYFYSFECGSTSNISPYSSISYYQFASTPTITIRVRSDMDVQKVNGSTVAGTENSKKPYEAYASWFQACKSWVTRQKQSYGQRFVAAECGSPRNVSKYASIKYMQYSSTGVLYLTD